MELGTRNVRTATYRDMCDLLPDRVRAAALDAFRMFLANPRHPGLALHELDDTKLNRFRSPSFSVRVTMQFRAVATIDGDTNVWYWIGPHSAYDATTGRR